MSYAQKLASGKAAKQVTCSGCGRTYGYELSRSVIGKSSKDAATKEEAEAQAAQDADAKLKLALASECDMVSCPSCGAITDEMKAHRRKFFAMAFAACGIGVGGSLLVYLCTIFLHRIFIFAAAASGVCLLLGVLVLILAGPKILMPRKGTP